MDKTEREKYYADANRKFMERMSKYKPNEYEIAAKNKANFYSLIGWAIGGFGGAYFAKRRFKSTLPIILGYAFGSTIGLTIGFAFGVREFLKLEGKSPFLKELKKISEEVQSEAVTENNTHEQSTFAPDEPDVEPEVEPKISDSVFSAQEEESNPLEIKPIEPSNGWSKIRNSTEYQNSWDRIRKSNSIDSGKELPHNPSDADQD